VLADCRCDAITQYHASLVESATSQLLIVMELMAATAADLVRAAAATGRQRAVELGCGPCHEAGRRASKGMHDQSAGTASPFGDDCAGACSSFVCMLRVCMVCAAR